MFTAVQALLSITHQSEEVQLHLYVAETSRVRRGGVTALQVALMAFLGFWVGCFSIGQVSLENASGQTAADLAHAQGFHDCFCFISNAQKHLQQRNEGNIAQTGGGAPCGLGALSRKRQLAALDAGHLKKAKRADGVLVQSSALEELDAMSLELSADFNNGHLHAAPRPPLSPPRCRRASAEMCGSLHLSSSPGGCVSNWPACLSPTGLDCGDFLHYGHYHGFGDTAEELSDSSCVRAEHPSKQAADGSIHLNHGS